MLAKYGATTLKGIQHLIPDKEPRKYLYDLVSDYPARGGKGFRPGLCIATCKSYGGDINLALNSAITLELLHNAFLIHDDVEDESIYRRNKPTMHQYNNRAIAINVGDAMNVLALYPLFKNKVELGPKLSEKIFLEIMHMTTESVEGQAMVVTKLPQGQAVPVVEYDEAAGAATGAVGGAVVGALIGGPVGAAIGGAAGAAIGANTPPPERVRTYVTENRVDPVYLDGEVVWVDDAVKTQFQGLQNVLTSGKNENIFFYVFDILHLDGQDLQPLPLLDRKKILLQLLKKTKSRRILFGEHWETRGSEILKASCKLGLEGIISKAANKGYEHSDAMKDSCEFA